MKKTIKYSCGFLAFILMAALTFICGPSLNVHADKSYSIKSLDIQANIQEDGSIDVTQNLTMYFSGGEFTKVYMDIPLTANLRTGKMTSINNVTVAEGNLNYALTKDTESKPDKHYYVSSDGSNLHIEWYHRSEDTGRTFTIKYKLAGAITSYNDTADLCYKFVGDAWGVPMDKVRVTITLPKDIEKSSIKVFGHGPLYGNVNILNTHAADWTVNKLHSKTYLECRMLFPKELIPGNKNIINENQYKSAMAEELQAAKKADIRKKLDRVFVIVGIADILAAILICIMNYMKYKKPHKIQDDIDYMRELPDDLSPAELNAFIKGGYPDTTAISATVLDLARKKYVSFEKSKKEVLIHVINREGSELNSYERDVLEFLKAVDAEGRGIKKFVSHNQEGARRFFKDFKNDVYGIFYSKHGEFFEEAPVFSVMIPILFMVVNVLLMFSIKLTSIVIIPFALAAISISIISFAFLKRRSYEGEVHFGKWMAFKRFLRHFSNLDKAELPEIAIWEYYLVYAAALGVAKEALKNLRAAYPEVSESYYGSWYNGYFGYYYMGTSHFGTGDEFNFFDNLVQDLDSSFRNAYTESTPSSTGGGGGFSGGGGFGGGGGGGGAS